MGTWKPLRNWSAIPLLAVIATACGGSPDAAGVASLAPTTSAASGAEVVDEDDALLEFATCMRENGVAGFRDPVIDAAGKFEFPDKAAGKDDKVFYDAYEACAPLLERTGVFRDKTGEDSTEKIDALYELAVCLREQGIDISDPDPATGEIVSVDKDNPKFEEAFQQCSETAKEP